MKYRLVADYSYDPVQPLRRLRPTVQNGRICNATMEEIVAMNNKRVKILRFSLSSCSSAWAAQESEPPMFGSGVESLWVISEVI